MKSCPPACLRSAARSLAVLSVVLLGASSVVPPASAQNGFPNTTRTAGHLFTPGQYGFSSDGRGAMIAFHGGLLYTMPEHPSSAPGSTLHIKVWDISSEAKLVSPLLVTNLGQGPNPINAHGFIYMPSTGSGTATDTLTLGFNWKFQTTGYQTYDRLSGEAPAEYLGVGSRDKTFPRWRIGKYDSTAGAVNGVWFYDTANTLLGMSYETTPSSQDLASAFTVWSTWDHLALTGVFGMPLQFGDLMVVMSEEQTLSGVAVYDLKPTMNSTGTPPSLLSVFKDGAIGGYWGELWGQGDKLYVFFPRRNSTLQGWVIVDISDPSNPVKIADVTGMPDPSLYVQFQDNFAFAGRYKIDMLNPLTPVLSLPSTGPNGAISCSQFAMPLGNLLVTGGQGSMEDQAWRIWAHQAAPDTTGPTVGYHRPRPNQTNYPRNAPLSFLIHETLKAETIVNKTSFIVKPVGGAAIDGYLTWTSGNQLNFLPSTQLAANTEYEVSFTAGGIKDVAGNGIQGYTFRFSTGSSSTGNAAPNITALSATPYPAAPNATVTFSATVSDPNGNPVEVRYVYGDGTTSAWSSTVNSSKIYSAAGRYNVVLQARDNQGAISTRTTVVTVMTAPVGAKPTHNNQLAVDESANQVWAVNPDNDTVTKLNASTNAKIAEYAVGADPRSIAIDSAGKIWVACHDADRIDVLNSSGVLQQSINTGFGSAPAGLALSPDGSQAYVALYGSGYLMKINTSTYVTSSLYLGPTPRAVAVSSNGGRVLVTRFISPESHGEVWDVNPSSMTLTRTIKLGFYQIPGDTSADARGLFNYLSAIAISPDGAWAWVTSKKDMITRGPQYGAGNLDLATDATVRAQLTVINLSTHTPDTARFRDIDNSDSPSAVAFSPHGDYAFVTLQGNNQVVIYDALRMGLDPNQQGLVARWSTGLAPQGVAIASTAGKLVINNFMGRTATFYSVNSLLQSGNISGSGSAVSKVATEKLSSTVLNGKRIFYNASDTRMSAEGYISCATCHFDGSHDGRTFDFKGRGEGLRNTIDLRGRAGTGHGPVHWTANFNEIQDFENDIRNEFGGSGFLSNADFTATQDPLGVNKAGKSADLDALAAYVTSLNDASLPKSPFRNSDGTRTSAATSGQSLFTSLSCSTCHVPSTGFRDNLRHNVGTLRATSGQRIGGTLSDIDTPTLNGLWDTAPYFHDGSAGTVADVFRVAGGTLLPAESGSLTSATLISSALDINQANASFGSLVIMSDAAATVTWNNVSSTAGNGRVELRYNFNRGGVSHPLSLIVNGTAYAKTIVGDSTAHEWKTVAWDNIPFNSGNNTVSIQNNAASGYPNFKIDHIVVSTPANLTAANAHRTVLAQSQANQDNLVAYLLQLDGRDANGTLPGGGGGTTGGSTGGTTGGLLAHDPFDYTTATALHGHNGGVGWAAGWGVQNSSTTLPGYSIGTGLSYSTLVQSANAANGGLSYLNVGRALDTGTSGAFASYLTSGNIGANGTSLYLSFLMRKDVDNNERCFIGLSPNTTAWSPDPPVAAGFFDASSVSGGTRYWTLRLNGSTHYLSSVPVTIGSTALLVVRIDFAATSTVKLWVNPSSLNGTEPAADVTATTTSSLAFKTLALRLGSNTGQAAADEMRIGSSFASVTPTPGGGTTTGGTTTGGTTGSGSNVLINGTFTDPVAGTLAYGVDITTTHAGQGWYENVNSARPLVISGGVLTGNGGTATPETLYQIVNNQRAAQGVGSFQYDVTTANSAVQWTVYGINGNASTVDAALATDDFSTSSMPDTTPTAPIVLLASGTFGTAGANQSASVDFGTGYDYLVVGLGSASSISSTTLSVDNLRLSGSGSSTTGGSTTGGSTTGSVLASDPFNYTSSTALHGHNGGTGWSAAWAVQNSSTTVPGYSIGSGLSYSGFSASAQSALGGLSYLSAGRAFDTGTSGPFATYLTSGNIGTNGSTLYLSFLMRKDVDNNERCFIGLSPNTTAWSPDPPVAVGFFDSSSVSGGTRYWTLRLNGSTYHLSSVPVTVGSTALLVVRIDFNATNTVKLWVNPTSLGGAEPTANLTATTTTSLAFKTLALRLGSNTGQAAADEIRVGTTYSAVTP